MSSPVDHGVDEDFKKLKMMNTIYGLTSTRKCEKINRQQKSDCSTSDEDWIMIERSTDHGVSYKLEENLSMLTELQELEAEVERLTDQLANKERELQAISSKGCESHQSQPLRHDVEEVNVDYDSMLKNESPQSTVLKIMTIALEKALQELPEYLQSVRNPFIPSISELSTPLQRFKAKTPHIQMTLVKEYLTVLNTATKEELLQLKGIGPKRAAHVLELRQQCQDPFDDLQDLKDIGIGKRELMSEFAKTMM